MTITDIILQVLLQDISFFCLAFSISAPTEKHYIKRVIVLKSVGKNVQDDPSVTLGRTPLEFGTIY